MVTLADLPHVLQLHAMESDRYSIRGTQVYDNVAGQFVTAVDIVENMRKR